MHVFASAHTFNKFQHAMFKVFYTCINQYIYMHVLIIKKHHNVKHMSLYRKCKSMYSFAYACFTHMCTAVGTPHRVYVSDDWCNARWRFNDLWLRHRGHAPASQHRKSVAIFVPRVKHHGLHPAMPMYSWWSENRRQFAHQQIKKPSVSCGH